ncbi:hypothetical protein QOZ80_1AG0006090 [Eleusine coracana subsp. coracana]|nr:hypothetical protein QOZ80_1AG0006090 [Eleusine coracana subsp. coracana]
MEDVAAVKAARKARRRFLVQFAVGCTSFVLCVLLYAPQFSMLTASYRTTTRLDADDYTAEEVLLVDDGGGGGALPLDLDNQVGSPCSSMPEHSICCDRSDANADVCFMTGDVRTDPASLSLLLFPPPHADEQVVERIRPYTRKWDPAVTKRIHEVTLRAARHHPDDHHCDVRHAAPAFVMTAGGYNAGNYFHAFNDGLLPAWLTTQHLRRRRGGVVLAVLAYDAAWAARHAEVLAGLSSSSSSASAHQIIDLVNDNRTHCFPGAIVGTRFHGYLAVDPARLRDNKTILDFHDFLAAVYNNNPPASQQQRGRLDVPRQQQQKRRPRLGIVSRRGTRVIENEAAVARLAARVGFDVDVIDAGKEAHRQLTLPALHAEVSGLDALVGAHGSDLTSLLFLRPGRAALVQVAPLGVAGLARGLFGVPAQRMGLRYEQYDARGHESSLTRLYAPDDVVVADPERAKRNKGGGDGLDWEFIGRVYLSGQNVTLDLARLGRRWQGCTRGCCSSGSERRAAARDV